MRNIEFAPGEYYHIYNRGTDKRNIVIDERDANRFLTGLKKFNNIKPIGSIFENSFEKEEKKIKPLVSIVAYCLNPNHFHLVLCENVERGIERFLHRQTMGYSKYFNTRHKRKGNLFQGSFCAKHIEDNDYLLYVGAYVNLNDRVHQLGHGVSKLVRNSWNEYQNPKLKSIVNPKVILKQFKATREYLEYAEDSLEMMLENKIDQKDLENEEEL